MDTTSVRGDRGRPFSLIRLPTHRFLKLRLFGGLLCLVTAARVYLCLAGAREKGPPRAPFAIALGLIVLKVALELALDSLPPKGALPSSIVAVAQRHLAGAVPPLTAFVRGKTKQLRQECLRSDSARRSRSVTLGL